MASQEQIDRLHRLRDEGMFWQDIADQLGVSEATARRMGKKPRSSREIPVSLPSPAPEAGGPKLPEPAPCSFTSHHIDVPGWWGVISDIHIPYHDLQTINKWVEECKSKNVAGLLLNGDVLDFYGLSDFLRDPSMPRTKEEISKGRQFLEYLRSQFPRIPIVYKHGNHDERLEKYLFGRCPDLAEIEDFQLHSLLRAKQYGVEWVQAKRPIMLGKLPVLHGHEYRGGGGVMPARWLYLRTGETAMCGHFHQPSTYTTRTVTGKNIGVWSTGCACFLSPAYAPFNQWSHGWAMVHVESDKSFEVLNRRLLPNGSVV